MRVEVRFDRSALVRQQVRRAAARALGEVTETALTDANKTVPHETGALQRSGFTQVDEANMQGMVAYDTAYAVVQHEDPDLRHDPPRRDHWLERAIAENRRRYNEHVAKAIRDATT